MHRKCVLNKPTPCCCNSSMRSLNWGCSDLLQWVKLAMWCRDPENLGLWASLNCSVFMNIGQSEVSESWSPIGIIKNLSNSLWNHYRSKFWRGRRWDLLVFLLQIFRLRPRRDKSFSLPQRTGKLEVLFLPTSLTSLPYPSNFSVLLPQQRHALRFALTDNCFLLTLPRGFIQQRSGSPWWLNETY